MPRLRRFLGWIAAYAAGRPRRGEPIVLTLPGETSNILAFPPHRDRRTRPRPAASADVIPFPGRVTVVRPVAEPPALTA